MNKFYISIIIVLGLIIFFLTYCHREKEIDNNFNSNIITKTDTVIKDKYILKRDTVKEFVLKPVEVIIYKKADTVYRKELEKQPIISAVDIIPTKHEVDVTTVDTCGNVKTTKYNIPEAAETLSVRPKETVVKKKTRMGRFFAGVGRFFKKTETWVSVVGAGVLGYYVAKSNK